MKAKMEVKAMEANPERTSVEANLWRDGSRLAYRGTTRQRTDLVKRDNHSALGHLTKEPEHRLHRHRPPQILYEQARAQVMQ